MSSLDDRRDEESRTLSFFLALFGILMVTTAVLICIAFEISVLKPCDLEKALGFLGLDIASPCTYNAIKNKSTSLSYLGTGEQVLNVILFMMIYFELRPEKIKWVLFFLAAVVGIIFSIVMIKSFHDVLTAFESKTDVNFTLIKKTMIDLLTTNYTSDNITSNNAISNNWNKFFIEYECCGINQVQGTTNDFDSTPWCTTSGSCQAAASQIPKTCCNDVSEDDYENAPTACYSSVTHGTYKSNCIKAIKLLSATNINEDQIHILLYSLFTLGNLEILKAVTLVVLMIKHGLTNRKTCTGRNFKIN